MIVYHVVFGEDVGSQFSQLKNKHLAWRYRNGVVRKHAGGELEKSHGRAVQWTLPVLSATEHGA